ncbi:DUF2306 domain-containing protein [Streptomyces antarcticus]|uniref:DUF2306 domain-containing protein n=1 Tax=Streptomyces antarcticus TaxID=2996458 RepID=UPI00226F3C1E|nr:MULTISPECIES: DUF2306 domain-containing protein [unclassified Streptomyces]MCY0942932.1 DUF2306 domain-containing protein [Streptomyces sp. H34-AA3]MCZ4083108.1 DUF2306 domain-containing protein [Streptomyces sp. H34-S5]
MAQNLQVAEARPRPVEDAPEHPDALPPQRVPDAAVSVTAARPWWRQAWVIPLAVVVFAFLMMVWPPYLGLDPKTSLIPIRTGSPAHYPMLVAHIATGTIALLTVILQLWPWIRRNRPELHRWAGRTYVYAGAVPSALLAFLITPLSMGPSVGTTLGGVLWLFTTGMGTWRAVQGNIRSHRQWMLYSFAFAINIVWGRVFVVLLMSFEVQNQAVWAQITGTAPWLGWVINLFLVQWWLNRTADRPVKDLI